MIVPLRVPASGSDSPDSRTKLCGLFYQREGSTFLNSIGRGARRSDTPEVSRPCRISVTLESQT